MVQTGNAMSAAIDVRYKVKSQSMMVGVLASYCWMLGSWTFHNNKVDPSANEADLSFRMCDLYSYTRG